MPDVLQQTYTMFFPLHIIPQTAKTGIGQQAASFIKLYNYQKKWNIELEILQKPS